MKIKGKGAEFVEIDMTPMIDMTFQLIAFFMILINFAEGEQDQRIQLPSSVLAKPPDAPFETPITIQMVRDGEVIMNGQLLPEVNAIRPYLNNEKDVLNGEEPERERRHDHHPGRPQRQDRPRAAGHQGLPGSRLREVHAACQIGSRLLTQQPEQTCSRRTTITVASGGRDPRLAPAIGTKWPSPSKSAVCPTRFRST